MGILQCDVQVAVGCLHGPSILLLRVTPMWSERIDTNIKSKKQEEESKVEGLTNEDI